MTQGKMQFSRRAMMGTGVAAAGALAAPALAMPQKRHQPSAADLRLPSDEVWAKPVPHFGRDARMRHMPRQKFGIIHDSKKFWMFNVESGEFAGERPTEFFPGAEIMDVSPGDAGVIAVGRYPNGAPLTARIPYPEEGGRFVFSRFVPTNGTDRIEEMGISTITAVDGRRARNNRITVAGYRPADQTMMIAKVRLSDMQYLLQPFPAVAMVPLAIARTQPGTGTGNVLMGVRLGDSTHLIEYEHGVRQKSPTHPLMEKGSAVQVSINTDFRWPRLVCCRKGEIGVWTIWNAERIYKHYFDASPDTSFQPSIIGISTGIGTFNLHIVTDGTGMYMMQVDEGNHLQLYDYIHQLPSARLPQDHVIRDVVYYRSRKGLVNNERHAGIDFGMLNTVWDGEQIWLRRAEENAAGGAVLLG